MAFFFGTIFVFTVYSQPLQSSASAPHIPQTLYQQSRIPEQPQFFLHDQPASPAPPQQPQQQQQQQQSQQSMRRTWAQQPQPPPISEPNYHHQTDMRTWSKATGVNAGFVLHDTTDRYIEQPTRLFNDRYHDNTKYQNGGNDDRIHHTLSQQHLQQQQQHTHYGTSHSTPSASPQHRNIHRQISQLLDDSNSSLISNKQRSSPVSLQQIDNNSSNIMNRERKLSITHAPIPAPSADDMEPQNISFIGNNDEQIINEGLFVFLFFNALFVWCVCVCFFLDWMLFCGVNFH